ncbi:MAG: PdaC/SigV domain-containing protein [Fusobacterium varium]|uniref:PdaC/SigV domain-containing protein n=1 Tax=Fusobacterium varium TaxID=856 RepID=UPI001F40DBB7|nr:DUF4163 domain-containing protein [Fusobacterium varium]MCF2672650.1 DUF3298 and DUF4163 domain-containing protein [Fusobacterium varium]
MKKMKSFFGLLLLVFLFISCENGKSTVKDNSNVEKLEYKENNEKYNYDVVIPQIKGVENEDISYLNLSLQESARIIIENLVGSADIGTKEAPIEAKMNYEIKENDFNILSLVITSYVYQGGAHGITTVETYNISKKNYSLLNYDVIFDENAEEYFNMKMNDIINKSKENNGSRYALNTEGKEVLFFENAEANVKNTSMYFEGNSVVFLYPHYEIAPYSSGMPIFKFDKKDIKKFVKIKI